MPPFKKLLLALAVLSCVFAAAWRFWVSEYLLSLPSDFSYEAEIISVDNFYDQEKGVYLGQQYSTSSFTYIALESTKTGMVVENRFQVFGEDGADIINIRREYGINPQTGEHIPNLGDKDREGYLFAPRYLEPGEEFTYWHVNYDGPAQMSYVEREELFGMEVYSYETHYENIVIDQTDELDYLEGVPEKWGILLEPHLKIWVEPMTGFLVNYEDSSTAYYYDIVSGEKLSPWNHFSNTYTQESVEAKVKEAYLGKIELIAYERVIPIGALILSALFLLFAFTKKTTTKENNYGIHWPIHAFFILFPISLIFVCWHLAESKINSKNELEFENRITEIEDAIIRRADIAINTLEGIQGLFKASQEVDREEWQIYIEQLDLEEKYPGIKVVGYSPIIWQADIEDHVAAMQAEGFPDYAIRPEGIRELYTPVIYVEPTSERNLKLMGFDAFSEEIRNEAMEFARDTGTAGMSGKLVFSGGITEGDQKADIATVIYIPIYEKNLPITSIEEKRTAIRGYAFAAFWIDEFIEGLFGTTPLGVNFTIYDGTELSADTLLYEYTDNPNEEASSFRTATEVIHVGGKAWTMEFTGLEEFQASNTQKWATWGLLWFVMLLCLLHIFMYFTLVSSRDRAMEWVARGSKRSTRKERIKR